MQSFRRFLELIRFSHTLFALPFALMSAALAWKAEGVFRWPDLLGILLCMVFARASRWAGSSAGTTSPRTSAGIERGLGARRAFMSAESSPFALFRTWVSW